MDCLLAKAIPCITDCVVAELEKLGPKYRVALRLSKDPRFQRLPCSHHGTYADDCLVQVWLNFPRGLFRARSRQNQRGIGTGDVEC